MAAFGSTFVLTPIMTKIAFRANILDRPSNDLKVHRKPIPYMGGIAILLGILISLSFAYVRLSLDRLHYWGLLSSAVFISSLGLLDDLFDIKQIYKFLLQILVAAMLVLIGYRVGTIPVTIVAIPLTMFFIVGACNALNLLDGLDGLAAGNSAIAALFFLVLFLIKGDHFGTSLSLSLLGASTAFLFFNYNPASIFMGDAGSMLIGLILSILMIRSSSSANDYISFFISVLICGVPVFDTALTYIRRYINKKPIFLGDRSHFYDQLIDKGFSLKTTVGIGYLLGIIFGVIALLMMRLDNFLASLVFLLVLTILVSVVWKMDMIKTSR